MLINLVSRLHRAFTKLTTIFMNKPVTSFRVWPAFFWSPSAYIKLPIFVERTYENDSINLWINIFLMLHILASGNTSNCVCFFSMLCAFETVQTEFCKIG